MEFITVLTILTLDPRVCSCQVVGSTCVPESATLILVNPSNKPDDSIYIIKIVSQVALV